MKTYSEEEKKELFKNILNVVAHAATQANKEGAKYADKYTALYFEFRNYIWYNL